MYDKRITEKEHIPQAAVTDITFPIVSELELKLIIQKIILNNEFV